MGEIGRAAGGEPQGNASLGRNCKKVHICLKLKMYLSFIAKKFVFVLPSSRGRATRQRLFFLLLLKMFNSIKQKNTIIRMPSSSHKTTPLLVKRKKLSCTWFTRKQQLFASKVHKFLVLCSQQGDRSFAHMLLQFVFHLVYQEATAVWLNKKTITCGTFSSSSVHMVCHQVTE